MEIEELTWWTIKDSDVYDIRVWGYSVGSIEDVTSDIVWAMSPHDELIYIPHREDGPAIINKIDNKTYYVLDGLHVTFDAFCKSTNKSKEEEMLLQLKYGQNFHVP